MTRFVPVYPSAAARLETRASRGEVAVYALLAIVEKHNQEKVVFLVSRFTHRTLHTMRVATLLWVLTALAAGHAVAGPGDISAMLEEGVSEGDWTSKRTAVLVSTNSLSLVARWETHSDVVKNQNLITVTKLAAVHHARKAAAYVEGTTATVPITAALVSCTTSSLLCKGPLIASQAAST